MPTELILDANVILRYLLGDNPEQAAAVKTLLEEAGRGAVRLHLTPLVMAECVWVLRSFYKLDPNDVAQVLLRFCVLDGLQIDQEGAVLAALQLMGGQRVDFADAFLAVQARSAGWAVASFDQDFRKLGCDVLVPGT